MITTLLTMEVTDDSHRQHRRHGGRVRPLSASWCVILATILPATAIGRTWTSIKGTTLEAELVEVKSDVVVLRDKSGNTREIRLDLLSQDDRKYLKSLETPSVEKVSPAMPFQLRWTNVSEELTPPASPLTGMLRGEALHIEQVELTNGRLAVGGSSRWFCVYLFPGRAEDLSGKAFHITGKVDARAPIAQVWWSESGNPSPFSETYLGDYAMSLTFGQPRDDYLPGRIYLCLPDRFKSVVAGEFAARIVRTPGLPLAEE